MPVLSRPSSLSLFVLNSIPASPLTDNNHRRFLGSLVASILFKTSEVRRFPALTHQGPLSAWQP
jgi:hypothetical protein